ncbi:MAG: hypothetical protein COA80_17215 [Leeuwenhoekiella sp.]|nr:MAG: hypothetical protein COA80_17215 [Leeuwenhoekiella sp.]
MISDLHSTRLKAAPLPAQATPLDGFGHLVTAIGDPDFERKLAGFVEGICGADQFYLFNVDKYEPHVRSALSSDGSDSAASIAKAYAAGRWWRFDSAMGKMCDEASLAPRLYQTDMMQASSDRLRSTLYGRMHLRDRIMVCGRAADDVIGISMLRSVERGPFGSDQRAQVEWMAQLAFPLVAKHWATVNRDRQLSRALTHLPDIERCIALAPEALPPREAAVCARYLYGQSTDGVAADLAIGRETVVTYRKRLYDRLGIGSHRELLLWYLNLYGSVRSRGHM